METGDDPTDRLSDDRAPAPEASAAQTGAGERRAVRRPSAALAILAGLVTTLGLAAVVLSDRREGVEAPRAVEAEIAFLAAQSGVTHAMANLLGGDLSDVGSQVEPVPFSTGSYRVEVLPREDGTVVLLATGEKDAFVHRLEVTVGPSTGAGGDALFAANRSKDLLYTLELAGHAGAADRVLGGVYSGGDVALRGEAEVTGRIRARWGLSGAAGELGVVRRGPDFARRNDAATADFRIVELFAGAAREASPFGGEAWQVPESNPVHVLRRDPDDRWREISSTLKSDWFLEDPYEDLRIDPERDGSDASRITLTGVAGEPGPSSDRRVFFVDGNLWLHGHRVHSFVLASDGDDGLRVTFVVRGNVYLADNLFLERPDLDAVAFVALADPDVHDSGNVYVGSPEWGGVESLSAMLFAERDIVLDAYDEVASGTLRLRGCAVAGEAIVVPEPGSRAALRVELDERLARGELELPGLPALESSPQRLEILSWRTLGTE